MHNCEEFRERITEHIIDREEPAAMAEFQNELRICSSCSEFCAESREMIEALSSVDLGISEDQWNGIEYRLKRRIHDEQPVAGVYSKIGARRVNSLFAEQKGNSPVWPRFFGGLLGALCLEWRTGQPYGNVVHGSHHVKGHEHDSCRWRENNSERAHR